MIASGTSDFVYSLRACAETLFTGPSRNCRVSAWCTPSWMNAPPGLLSAYQRQVCGVSSRPRSLEKLASASETSPSRPSSIQRFISRWPDSRRELCPTAKTSPVSSTAAAIWLASSSVCAIGLSV